MQGRVLWGANNIFMVLAGQGRLACRIKGKVLQEAERAYNPLAPGDLVELEPDRVEPGKGVIVGRLPRSAAFTRWNKKGRRPQILAANCNLVVCVTSPDNPPFRPRFVDRVLVACDFSGLEALVLINKADHGLASEVEERIEDYRRLGYQVLAASALTGLGLLDLRARLKESLAVFVGQSGVGKTSLLNRLHPGMGAKTGPLSEKYNRGRHTTVCGRLEPWDGGPGIIDTPGVREFDLWGLNPAEAGLHFRDFAPFREACAFAGCTHQHEPDCGVREAVRTGLVLEDRYESYLRIVEELELSRRTEYE